MGRKLSDGPLSILLNGSGINNIPRLNIITSNVLVATTNRCGNGPVFIGLSEMTAIVSGRALKITQK
jgi:hypothetical protein